MSGGGCCLLVCLFACRFPEPKSLPDPLARSFVRSLSINRRSAALGECALGRQCNPTAPAAAAAER